MNEIKEVSLKVDGREVTLIYELKHDPRFNLVRCQKIDEKQ